MFQSVLREFINEANAAGFHILGIAVQKNGQFLGEYHWAPDVPRHLFSVSKIYSSTAIGMAIDEGILSLDDRVSSAFPEYMDVVGSGFSEELCLRDLLIMASGHSEAAFGRNTTNAASEDLVRTFLEAPFPHKPGTTFVYDSGCTYLAGAMLQKVTGMTLADYLYPRLFKKQGMERPYWETCSRGRTLCGKGLYLHTKDILKIGQLYLQHGNWNGEQLISEYWVKEATHMQIKSHKVGNYTTDPNNKNENDYGYGYQFWMNSDGTYRGDGKNGQYCVIDENNGIVIALNSDQDDPFPILNLVLYMLKPALENI